MPTFEVTILSKVFVIEADDEDAASSEALDMVDVEVKRMDDDDDDDDDEEEDEDGE